MPEPTHTPLGARLRERTQPLAPDDASYDWAHAHLCEALGVMLEQVGEVFDPEGEIPPLAPILDVELCPDWALPWLGQLVGVQLPRGISADDARALIASAAGFQRGTPAAMRAAVELTLTDTRTMFFRERLAGDAYALEVVTLTTETPNPAQTLAALLTQKPGGVKLTHRTIVGVDYTYIKGVVASYTALKTRYASYSAMKLDQT